MFDFLKKSKGKAGLVGVSYTDKELTIAHISYVKGVPTLHICESFEAETNEDRAKILQDKVDDYGLEDTRCNFILAPQDYNLLLVEAPAVQKAEMAAAVRWKIKDMIDKPVDQLSISVFPVPADAYRSQTDMIYVVAANKPKVLHVIDFIAEANLRLDVIDIPELAMKNLTDFYLDDSNGLAFMDLRKTGSKMNLCKGDSIYLTRHLNTQVDQEIMSSYEWDSVKERLVLEIQRSLDYYESQMGQSQIPKILIAPREKDSEALANQLNQSMGVDVEIMDLGDKLGKSVELTLPIQQACMMSIGGALRQESAA